MARQPEVHTSDVRIAQRPDILDPDTYDGDVLIGEKVVSLDYAEALQFNEEPVAIRIEPSSDQNASKFFPVWVNGQGAEIFVNRQWIIATYLPVGEVITVRRKVLENILRSKVDKITNEVENAESERPNNRITRVTTAVHALSIVQDKNPRGAAWATEIMRRNM